MNRGGARGCVWPAAEERKEIPAVEEVPVEP
jgi:hypothetical protein